MALTRLAPAALTACLFFLLFWGAHLDPGRSVGFTIDIAFSPKGCGDARYVVATLVGNHQAKLNDYSSPFGISDARWVIRNRLSTRTARLVYVRAEAGVPFGEFVEFVDAIWPEVEVLSWITPGLERERSWCLSPSERSIQRLRNSRRFTYLR